LGSPLTWRKNTLQREYGNSLSDLSRHLRATLSDREATGGYLTVAAGDPMLIPTEFKLQHINFCYMRRCIESNPVNASLHTSVLATELNPNSRDINA
jgi:hypothetical protein